MGYGEYSYEAHTALTTARQKQTAQQVFRQVGIHPSMNPFGVKYREARDTKENPSTLAIVFALDVSGSMREIPEQLARKQLPRFMKTLGDCGVVSPQVLFMALTDHKEDGRPLQVGQFETTAELMDQWLTRCSLSGGGVPAPKRPSNTVYFLEAYELAFYFAARHTVIDCWEKRKKKGYLFVTGDEAPYSHIQADVVKDVIGDRIADAPFEDVITAVKKTYEPFVLIPDAARARSILPAWQKLLGDRVIVLNRPEDTTNVAAGLVALGEGLVKSASELEAMVGGSATQCLEPWLASSRR